MSYEIQNEIVSFVVPFLLFCLALNLSLTHTHVSFLITLYNALAVREWRKTPLSPSHTLRAMHARAHTHTESQRGQEKRKWHRDCLDHYTREDDHLCEAFHRKRQCGQVYCRLEGVRHYVCQAPHATAAASPLATPTLCRSVAHDP